VNATQVLNRKAIDEFKAIYEQELGKILSDDEAREVATRLLRFLGTLIRPLPGESTDHTTHQRQPT
jgi:hypothetical protein